MLARALTFSPDQDESFFQQLPAAPAVFLLRGEGEPYVSKTASLHRRLQRLLGPPAEHSKRLNLRDRVREVEFSQTGSDFESQFLIYRLLRETSPNNYAARLRLRPAPLLRLHLENEYPRASVTTRLGRLDSKNLYYGPFPSRASAEKFANDGLDFFKMRRCVDDLHPDPAFPGCVYSEIKMCLAPCFKGCTDAEYLTEVGRVQAFFDTAGGSLTRELTGQRERAAAQLAFEEAAAVHAKLEKLNPVLAQLPEIVQPISRLAAVIVQPSAEPGSVSVFQFSKGILQGPALFHADRSPSQLVASASTLAGQVSGSMESRVQELIQSFPPVQMRSTLERTEHLAILKRWYYRSHRTGEIFFADDKAGWPLRRIVRGIGRVYRGEKPQEPTSFSATQPAASPSEPT